MKEIWKKVNCYKNRQQENKNIISLDDPWIEDFSRNLTPYYVENQMSQDLATEDENEPYLTKSFHIQELNRTIKINNNSAPGKDNIVLEIHYFVYSN